jgi:hypothetical protein
MPNGSHGWAKISQETLQHYFDSLQEDLIVGQLFDQRDRREVVASEVRHLIQSVGRTLILLDKVDMFPQVGTALVIHLPADDEPEALKDTGLSIRLRVQVTEDRSIFGDLEKLWLETLARSESD